MNPTYNYLNNNQSYYQQNMNNMMYQGQNGNYNQQINNGQMMNYNQNNPYMNQMNYNNNLLYNQNLMNNNRSKSHAYFVSRFQQNNINNNMFNNPTFNNNNMNNNINNMNNFNNMTRYNNIGSINNSNNFNNLNNNNTNNNIASFTNNSYYNNINSYNNSQNINNMNIFNNNTMNNNNIFNNMNNYNNNVNTNNYNNKRNTNNTKNMNSMLNPHTMIQHNKNMHNQQKRNYNKRDSNANRKPLTNNISTYKDDLKEYQKRDIPGKTNDIKKETSNKNGQKNISDKNNLKNEIPNYTDKLKQNDKSDIKKESLNNDNQDSKKDNCNEKTGELKQIKDIIEEKPFEEYDLKLNGLIKARGLENVGATCYMNATLQCFYHVKQLSEALVNDDKISEKLELTYSFKKLIEGLAFTNIRKYKIDRQYNRVTGENIKSFKPENFKEVLSRKNPLFKGIQANDSKDLIIYLLQEMDKELTLRNNNISTMKMFIGNDESELEKEKFKEFHNSIFCDLFYGFQKSDMICDNCKNCNSTYIVFNNLVLPIEKTYNSLNDENKNKNRNRNRSNNLVNMFNPQTCQTFGRRPGLNSNFNNYYGYNNYNNYNNFNNTPDLPRKLDVHQCLKECFKDELLSGENQIYCNKCRKMSNSINRTTIYKAPNVLILILNRGRGNSFECEIKFSSKEILDLSRYNIISQDSPKKYQLFGVISHIGESSDEGHFIAYCKHFDDNWYMFNDSIAKTVGENELTNGVPYILFYRNINIDKEFGN